MKDRSERQTKMLLKRYLHDNVNSLLAMAVMEVNLAQKDGSGDSDALDKIDLLLRRVIKEIEKIGLENRVDYTQEEFLGDLNFLENIASSQLECFTIDSQLCNKSFNIPYEEITSIIRELVSNSIKYSSSKKVHLKIRDSGHFLVISYVDFTDSFNLVGNGSGLRNITQRLNQLGGKLEIATSESQLQFIISVPHLNNEDYNS